MPVIHIICINNLLIPASEIILKQHASGSVLSMAEGKQGHACPPTKALVQLITHNLIIVSLEVDIYLLYLSYYCAFFAQHKKFNKEIENRVVLK